MKAASFIINSVVFLLVVDMAANTILFIVRREGYVEWCINTTSAQLNAKFLQDQQSDEFNVNTTDFYNCKRTWEDELKFSVLSTIVMITVYVSFHFCKRGFFSNTCRCNSFIWLSVSFHIASSFVSELSMKSWVGCEAR